jgi:hypothetical protein
MVTAKVMIDSHYSDLYVELCDLTISIMKEYPAISYEAFHNEVTGTIWLDIPFCFTPYWENLTKGTVK